jgi:nucleoside-diphosphate-sugar epimerase
VGAVLVPRLLGAGYRVRVLDLYVFGRDALASVRNHAALEEVEGDLRDERTVRAALAGIDTVIHLACISNDPSCDLDPALSRAINYDAFEPLLRMSRDAGVGRFIFASSSSVYGISDAPEVREDHPLKPITDYNRYKGMCEEVLFRYQSPVFTTVAIRPGTVCGRSPRQRLDLTVNILTTHAVERGRITVFGGEQRRPNIHMDDMVDLYLLLLEAPAEKIAGQAFNAGYENLSIRDVAGAVREVVESAMPGCAPIAIDTAPSNDPRSYHVNSEKLARTLAFSPRRGVRDGARAVAAALREGALPGALEDERYYNVKMLKALQVR